MTEYSAADMQVAVSRIAAANMSQAPYPLTTEQWAALRSAPATIERLEAHSSYFVDGFAAGTEAAAKIADATAVEVDDGCSDRRMICESIATDIRAEIGDK